MNLFRGIIALIISGFLFWQVFGPNPVQGNGRAFIYGLLGGILLVIGIWRLVIAFRTPKAEI